MKFDPDVHHRRSIRMKGFDYSTAGAYFVTICVQGRECLLGEIVGGEMVVNESGRVIDEWWQNVPVHFPHVQLDEYVIMPNHFHGILWIVGAGSPRPISPDNQNQGGETPNNQNQGGETPNNQNQGGETPPLPTLGQIVGYFKYQSTKEINRLRGNPGVPLWQRNYYERVIRGEDELYRARRYIRENPAKWDRDEENPDLDR